MVVKRGDDNDFSRKIFYNEMRENNGKKNAADQFQKNCGRTETQPHDPLPCHQQRGWSEGFDPGTSN